MHICKDKRCVRQQEYINHEKKKNHKMRKFEQIEGMYFMYTCNGDAI